MMQHRKDAFGILGLMTVWLFVVVGPTVAAPPQGRGRNQKQAAWQDNFDSTKLDSTRWVVAAGGAPGYIAGNHMGYYEPAQVTLLDGKLRIRLAQQTGSVDGNPNGVISRGGLIYTKQTYGYGTYEWRMRMSSTAATASSLGTPVSGSVSAGFIYVDNSKTEIDFEFAGHLFDGLYMANWYNTDPLSAPTDDEVTFTTVSVPGISTQFKTFKFVWEEGRISFYVDVNGDGVAEFLTSHLTNVPRAPAYFMINHWGTNNPWFGGMATTTPGNERYFYVDWVRYTPLP